MEAYLQAATRLPIHYGQGALKGGGQCLDPNPTFPSLAWLCSNIGGYLSIYALLFHFESIFTCNWIQALEGLYQSC